MKIGIFGIIFVIVLLISVIWIRNLYLNIKFYKDEINNYLQKDKTFVVVQYKHKKTLKAELTEIKIAPKESYEVKQNNNYDLVGFSIIRKN